MKRVFRHYKTGNLYEYVGEATHSETMELMVIYKSVETGTVWARPKEMFFGWVHPGRSYQPSVRRFEEVKNEL